LEIGGAVGAPPFQDRVGDGLPPLNPAFYRFTLLGRRTAGYTEQEDQSLLVKFRGLAWKEPNQSCICGLDGSRTLGGSGSRRRQNVDWRIDLQNNKRLSDCC